MKCDHPKYMRNFFLTAEDRDKDPLHGTCNVCTKCKVWLPLSPAALDTPDILTEIRAAEIASPANEMIYFHPAEWDGWCGWDDSPYVGTSDYDAGRLAREIYVHDDVFESENGN